MTWTCCHLDLGLDWSFRSCILMDHVFPYTGDYTGQAGYTWLWAGTENQGLPYWGIMGRFHPCYQTNYNCVSNMFVMDVLHLLVIFVSPEDKRDKRNTIQGQDTWCWQESSIPYFPIVDLTHHQIHYHETSISSASDHILSLSLILAILVDKYHPKLEFPMPPSPEYAPHIVPTWKSLLEVNH